MPELTWNNTATDPLGQFKNGLLRVQDLENDKTMETLYASFAEVNLAQKAVGALLDHGVADQDLTLIANFVGADGQPDGQMQHAVQNAKEGISTTSVSDAGAGMAKGAGIGLGVGVLAALASLFIPGFGLVTGGGALALALGAGAATTAAGAVAGGVTGYLVDQGVPADIAVDYENARANGGAIISVQLPLRGPSRADMETILTKYQASRISLHQNAAIIQDRVAADGHHMVTALPITAATSVLDNPNNLKVVAQMPAGVAVGTLDSPAQLIVVGPPTPPSKLSNNPRS